MFKKVSFSRLLKDFELNNKKAFIVELDVDGEKKLYLSYFNSLLLQPAHSFIEKEKIKEKELIELFDNLSDHCLLKDCKDASYMFYGSIITTFSGIAPKLIKADSMFSWSEIECFYGDMKSLTSSKSMFFVTPKLKQFSGHFPMLNTSKHMFEWSDIESFLIDLPSLKKADRMFYNSKLKLFKSKISNLQEANEMFASSKIKTIDFKKFKINHISANDIKKMFLNTKENFKKKYPFIFV